MKKIVCVGDNCIDCYDQTGERFPGGNSVNVSVYFRRLGVPSSYIGAVGMDDNGKRILDSLKGKNVDVSHVKILEGATGVTHVRMVKGDRVFVSDDPGVNAGLTLTEEDLNFISEHDLFVTGLWGYTEPFLPLLKERGIPIAYDASNHPSLPQVQEGIKYADYLFFSDDSSNEDQLREQMASMAAEASKAAIAATAAMGPKLVVAMRGALGSLALEDGRYKSMGIVNCPVVDTMGAGDSYIAGFLKARLEGADLAECMKKGAENAAVTIGYKGAW